MKAIFSLVTLMAVSTVFAFQQAPKASGAALGVTKGKQFASGLAFVNGKLIEPPYVVERWGTCIRINKIPVTNQIIDWNEFLKTQPGVKIVKPEETSSEAQPTTSEEIPSEAPASAETPAPAETPVAAEPAKPAVTIAAAAESIDDLFDGDDDKPEKSEKSEEIKPEKVKPAETAAANKPVEVPAKSKPASANKTRQTAMYVLEGPFVHNVKSKKLLAKVNDERTKIDRILRSGGFVFFGDRYSRITGDARTLSGLLDALPEKLQNAKSLEEFSAGVNDAGLVYVNGLLCQDLFNNRIGYRRLRELRDKRKNRSKLDQVLQGVE